MAGECADGGAGTGFTASVGDFGAEKCSQSRLHESPSAHVLRFFLAPDELRAFWKRLEHFAQLLFCERINLLDANDRSVVDLALRPIIQQIVINLARAKDDSLHVVGRTACK